MILKWETKQGRVLKGMRMSGEKKLEGIRLMNELADKVLSKHQKRIRQKFRKAS
jgi:hypothetical protein